MLLKVFSIVPLLALLWTQLNVVLACCLIMYLLYCKLIRVDKIRNHSLETCNRVVCMRDGVCSVVWLIAVSWWRHSSTFHWAFFGFMSLKNHTVITEDVKARYGNQIWVIPKTVILGSLSTSVPHWPACGWLLLGNTRFIVQLTGLESAFRVIRILLANFHHGSDVSRLVSSGNVDIRGGLVGFAARV